MPWICECGEIAESRSKYLQHKGTCQTKDININKCDLQECALPVTEEPFCDLILNSELDSVISTTNNVLYGAQMPDLFSPTEEPILENLINLSQGEVVGLPVIDEARLDLSISLEDEFVVDNKVNTEYSEQHSDYRPTSLSAATPSRPTEYNQLISDTLCDISQDWLDNEEIDDSDADPDWSPSDDQRRKRKLLPLQLPKRRRIVNDNEYQVSEDSDIPGNPDEPDVQQGGLKEPQVLENVSNTAVTPEPGKLDFNVKNISASSKIKRKKGIRVREVEKAKKDQGLSYKTRAGKIKPPVSFQTVKTCCKKNKCYDLVKPEIQQEIFNNFKSLPVSVRDQTLCERIEILNTKTSYPGRGKSNATHNRLVTVSYSVNINGKKESICKKMFMGVYGVTRGKVDIIVEKLRASPYGVIETDMRGRHEPPNKTNADEINGIHQFIDLYPRHESHYARRDCSSEKIFLPSHLSVKNMYNEYLKMRVESGNEKSVCYDIFRKVFNTKGYKFKQPYIDTCKTCDAFNVSKRHASNKPERDSIDDSHKSHILEAQEGYDKKREDKANAKEIDYQRALVFDLQQVLPVPYLTTNIAYYKRLLAMYNLTIRDCSRNESSECFLWSELEGGRGSEQIASCIFKKILELPNSVEQIITYSDTCGGQNRNINMAVMFMYAVSKKDTLQVIDQKFLLPGHTRLECDSDHARIERAKECLAPSGLSKNSPEEKMRIMVPRDWTQFIRSLPGKKKFRLKCITMILKHSQHF